MPQDLHNPMDRSHRKIKKITGLEISLASGSLLAANKMNGEITGWEISGMEDQ